MSQLRKHLKFTFKHRLRSVIQGLRLGELGGNVYIDDSVKFMRFPKKIYVGSDVVVKEGARICVCNENALIKIGDRTTVGYHTFIFSSNTILIGDDCLIAPFVYIVDSDHGSQRENKINSQPNSTEPIQIGNDVWIASNVTILKGVRIEDGAVIAANSVVNSNVGAYEIWGGSPAKKIGNRK